MAIHTLEHARRLAGTALAVLSLACVPIGTVALAADVPDGLGATLIDGYIRPATQDFADAGTAMHIAMQGYCAALHALPAGDATLARTYADRAQDVRRRFSKLAQAWARVEFLRFGPLVQDNRFERIFFWPDPRGTVQRRTQAALGARDKRLLEAGALRTASVAIQGLPSLEYALYGGSHALLHTASPSPAAAADTSPANASQGDSPQRKPSADDASATRDYRCAYAGAVAANVALLATEVAQAWGPDGESAKLFAHPGPANPLYRTPAEVASEMIKALSGGVHYMRDAKLLAALGATPAEARPDRAPLFRSDATLDSISAGLHGMAAFYRAAHLQTALAPTDAWLATVVTSSADHIADRLEVIDMPLEQALAQARPRETLVSTVVELKSLKETIDGQIASALGINIGFNALDGD